jgi:RND family efflux transporter MFP subunit
MKRILPFVVPILILLLLVGWRIETKTSANAALQQQSQRARKAPAVVALATAGPKQIASNLSVVGSLESPFQVKLSPNVSGRIDYLQVREGDPVHVGQILARIDPQYVEGQILQAQSNLAMAQQKLDQARITQNANTVSIENAIREAKASVASTLADYNEARVTYEHTVGAAHEATVDAQAKVASASSNVQSSEAAVELAKANLDNANASYARTYQLYHQGYDSAQDLDNSNAARKVNTATVNSQQKLLEANKSALKSAQAEERAAYHQEQTTTKLGLSTIEDQKAKYEQAKQALDTAVANRSQIPAYTENLAALYSEVVAAKAAVSQALAQRQYLIVTSSIDGTVTQRLFDPGAEAVPGTPLLVVQANNPLFMTAAVPVEDSSYIHRGMDMRIRIDALQGRTFHAKMSQVNQSADPASRQFMIRAVLDNKQGLFRPGMYCRVQLTTSYVSAAVAVPREAVKTDSANASTVTVVDKNMKAHIVPVTVGVQDANNVQILSGVKAGDRVVVLSYRTVVDGGQVQEGTWSAVKAQGGRPSGKGGPNDQPSADLGGGLGQSSSGGSSTGGSASAGYGSGSPSNTGSEQGSAPGQSGPSSPAATSGATGSGSPSPSGSAASGGAGTGGTGAAGGH